MGKQKLKQIDRISVSALRSYLTCQRQYELSNIQKLERKQQSVYFAFGSAMHNGAEPIWAGGDPDFGKAWRPYKDQDIDYKTAGDWASFHSKGMQMAAVLWSTMKGKVTVKDPKQIELSDNFELESGVTVSRRLDIVGEIKRMFAFVDGKPKTISGPVILDLKTASRKYNPKDALTSLQLMGYMPPVQSIKLKRQPETAAFLVITKSIKPEVQIVATTITQKKINAFIDLAGTVSSQVNATLKAKGKFPMNPGANCNMCDFYDLCYARPGGKKKYQERLPYVKVEKEIEADE